MYVYFIYQISKMSTPSMSTSILTNGICSDLFMFTMQPEVPFFRVPLQAFFHHLLEGFGVVLPVVFSIEVSTCLQSGWRVL